MSKTVKATHAQVRATRLIVERASRGIGHASPAVRAIAKAKPARNSDLGPVPASLQTPGT